MDKSLRLIPAMILPSHQPTTSQGCLFPMDWEQWGLGRLLATHLAKA